MRKTHLTHRRGGDPVDSITSATGSYSVQVFGRTSPDDSMRTLYKYESMEPGWYPVCGAPMIPPHRRKPGGPVTCANCRRTKAYAEWIARMRDAIQREEAA